MGITPTTKAQVSGHKFLARRIEHGLVFGDIRMIHDPLAKRRRALGFGLAACVLIALGAVALGIFRPAVDPGDAGIIKAETGQLYVRLEDRLHPVPNLVSARLIVGEPVQAKSASAAVIGDIPKAAPIGIGDAPTFMPEIGAKQPTVTAHACHSVPTLTSRLDISQAQLTVVFHPEAAPDTYAPLKPDTAILAEVNNAEWVIRATGSNPHIGPSKNPALCPPLHFKQTSSLILAFHFVLYRERNLVSFLTHHTYHPDYLLNCRCRNQK